MAAEHPPTDCRLSEQKKTIKKDGSAPSDPLCDGLDIPDPSSPGAVIPQRTRTNLVDHSQQVLAQYHEAHLTTDLLEASHQEVVPAKPTLEGTERMFDQVAALTHPLWPLFGHPLLMGRDQLGRLASVNAACSSGGG